MLPGSPRPRRKLPIPEKAIMNACLGWLRFHHVMCWRQNSGGMAKSYTRKRDGVTRTAHLKFNSERGMSDICAVLPGGRFAAIEVKRDDGRLSDEQAEFLDRVRNAGGVGIVVRSVDDLEREIGPLLPRPARVSCLKCGAAVLHERDHFLPGLPNVIPAASVGSWSCQR